MPLRYRACADIWLKALQENKVKSNEYEIPADSKRDLGLYTAQELLNHCEKAEREFYMRPKHLFNLFKKSLNKNDSSILRMLLFIYLSHFIEHFNPTKSTQDSYHL